VSTDSGPRESVPGRAPGASACEPYRELIVEAVAHGRNAVAIWQDLVDDHGFAARYASVRRFVRALRVTTPADARVVITTAAGEEAQVDYGDGPMVRHPEGGQYRRTRLFVLTLGYSRKAVRLLTWHSSTQGWAELHEQAFRRLGGAPRVVVLDNLKEGVLMGHKTEQSTDARRLWVSGCRMRQRRIRIGRARKGRRSRQNNVMAFAVNDIVLRIPVLRGFFRHAKACQLACEKSADTGAPIFVFVHGTWGWHSPWGQPDASLVKEVTKRWPGAGIYRYEWSGINGARHRLVASQMLTLEIDSLAASFPESPIVALCHSHGGNVVAWASSRLESTLSSAVYLNTPFIHLQPREFESAPYVQMFFYLIGTYLTFSLLWIVDRLFLASRDWPSWMYIAIGLCAIATVALETVVVTRVNRLRRALEEVSNSPRRIGHELVVSLVGDEAGSALSGIYFSHWFFRNVLPGLYALIVVAAGVVLHLRHQLSLGVIAQYWSWFATWSAPLLLFLPATLAACTYGIKQGLIAIDSPVAVTSAPLGKTDTVTIGWQEALGLRHSQVFQSPQVTEAVSSWLTEVGLNVSR
jgi:hypothetical protein